MRISSHHRPSRRPADQPLARLTAVVLAAVVLVVGCTPSGGERVAPDVEPPRNGAWVGAWVKPQPEQTLSTAVADFESDLGGTLDVVQVYRGWDEEWPTAEDRELAEQRRLLVSWAGTDTIEIADGLHDDLIRERARAVAEWGKPLLLRWRWEMDRPNLKDEVHGPQEYVAAWRHVHDIFQEEGATNASWVWCPLAVGFREQRAQPYYPGDDTVDWLCADVYPGWELRTFEEGSADFLEWAEDHPQPILIAEFGMQAKRGERFRQSWIRESARFVRSQPRIKGWLWFDADNSANAKPYDMSLRNASGSMRVFAEMASDPYFDVDRRR